MPTYRAKFTQPYISIYGAVVTAQAGQEVESYEILPSAQWDLVSDAPYYNPCAGVHEIESDGMDDLQVVILHGRTDMVEIHNASDAEISVFLQSVANEPAIPVPSNTVRTISGLKGKVTQVILQFSQAGSCKLTEMKG